MDEETGLAIKDHRGPSASVNDSPFGEMCGARGRRRARRGFWVAAAAAGLLLVLWAAIPRRRHSEEMPVVDAGLAGSDNGLATQQYSLALVPTDVALARQQKLSKTSKTSPVSSTDYAPVGLRTSFGKMTPSLSFLQNSLDGASAPTLIQAPGLLPADSAGSIAVAVGLDPTTLLANSDQLVDIGRKHHVHKHHRHHHR
mmetsp:Transcript_30642/g.81963  ORF Transcript_30642/g.81963 Transcript_30642/m.81963 type:complete len:199 (-) Transcript_30642:591-1187(-)